MTRWLAGFALALPGVIVALTTGASGVATFVDGRPLILAPQPASLVEAARYRDGAEVVLRLALGEDMERPGPVRLSGDHYLTLTPLEAAVASEQLDMVRLMLDRGATLDAPALVRIRCFIDRYAVGSGMREYFAALDASPLVCAGVAVP